MSDKGDEATEQGDVGEGGIAISRLNSISDRVNDVTDKTRKLLNEIKDQTIATKTSTPATKKTLDGIMIDERLTEPTGVLYKAKMIGSLSVAFHKGDKMAADAMRDLKIMAKTSGRHKARIFLRISIQGVHILEDGTMKQIDIHDLDKISYLAEDMEDNKVFAYIYNKQILHKDTATSTIVHRLFAIKAPKSALIVSNMKAVFHYMHDMRMSDNKPNSKNVDMAEAKKKGKTISQEIEATNEEELQVEIEDKVGNGDYDIGFGYGKLVNLLDCEEDIIKVAIPEPQVFEPATRPPDTGPAVNLYTTTPKGNRLECVEIEDDEPLYSTVRKIKVPIKSTSPTPRIEVTSEMGTVNPSWNTLDELSFGDDDPFSLDKYNRKSSSSSESDEEITVFGVSPPQFGVSPLQKETIPSAVFMDDYEWDIGEMRTKKYSEGHIELTESRERLSTVTKKAVASLERAKNEQQSTSNTIEQQTTSSLIDFATFEDRIESSNAVDLFDSLKDKPSSNTPHTDDLLSIDFSQQNTTPQKQVYSNDINSLMGNPNAYPNTGPTAAGIMPSSNQMFVPNISSNYQATSGPNYQPTYSFPVNFATSSNYQMPVVSSSNSINPFHSSKNKDDTFDPFSDLINDAI